MTTPRQLQVLEHIKAFRRQHGKSPTMREIGKHLGIRNPNGVHCHVLALEKKGLVRWDRRQARSIIPIGETDPRDEVIVELVAACESFLFWFNSDGSPCDGFRFREEQAGLRAAVSKAKVVFSSAEAV